MKMPNEVAWALKKAKARRYYHIICYSIGQHDVLITICFILRKDVSLLPCSTISDKNFLANTQAYGKYVITLPRHVRGCNVITRLYSVLREKNNGQIQLTVSCKTDLHPFTYFNEPKKHWHRYWHWQWSLLSLLLFTDYNLQYSGK
jgi:hypothetical protein